jgi:hypothetical protein
MKPEASCSGVPVLLLKVTTEVIVSRFSTRGVATTRVAQRRERRACMMKAKHSRIEMELNWK